VSWKKLQTSCLVADIYTPSYYYYYYPLLRTTSYRKPGPRLWKTKRHARTLAALTECSNGGDGEKGICYAKTKKKNGTKVCFAIATMHGLATMHGFCTLEGGGVIFFFFFFFWFILNTTSSTTDSAVAAVRKTRGSCPLGPA